MVRIRRENYWILILEVRCKVPEALESNDGRSPRSEVVQHENGSAELKPHLVSSMIKFSFWLFLFSSLALIFGILFFNNLHEEEILVERIKQTSDREIEREKLLENDEKGKNTETKKVKKVGLSR